MRSGLVKMALSSWNKSFRKRRSSYAVRGCDGGGAAWDVCGSSDEDSSLTRLNFGGGRIHLICDKVVSGCEDTPGVWAGAYFEKAQSNSALKIPEKSRRYILTPGFLRGGGADCRTTLKFRSSFNRITRLEIVLLDSAALFISA
jgi:hypothetical protein